jgi:1-acyl-sn-glycerol-3-phosphate acyltransferase
MSDLFYRMIRLLGTQCFFVSATDTVLGVEHVPRTGPFILAATHHSHFDVPLLIRHTPRLLDFVSITEVFQNPFVAWFYGSMNAFPLDRSRPDPKTVRIILNRLEQGRAVAMFPEGRIRAGEESVLHTKRIRRGLGRIAQLANVPVVPAVILNSDAYLRVSSWLPLRRVRYGVIYGEPMEPPSDPDAFEQHYIEKLLRLNEVIKKKLD